MWFRCCNITFQTDISPKINTLTPDFCSAPASSAPGTSFDMIEKVKGRQVDL